MSNKRFSIDASKKLNTYIVKFLDEKKDINDKYKNLKTITSKK